MKGTDVWFGLGLLMGGPIFEIERMMGMNNLLLQFFSLMVFAVAVFAIRLLIPERSNRRGR